MNYTEQPVQHPNDVESGRGTGWRHVFGALYLAAFAVLAVVSFALTILRRRLHPLRLRSVPLTATMILGSLTTAYLPLSEFLGHDRTPCWIWYAVPASCSCSVV